MARVHNAIKAAKHALQQGPAIRAPKVSSKGQGDYAIIAVQVATNAPAIPLSAKHVQMDSSMTLSTSPVFLAIRFTEIAPIALSTGV